MEDSLETGYKKEIYSVDTFNLHESIKYSHQKARGIHALPGAVDSACHSTQGTCD